MVKDDVLRENLFLYELRVIVLLKMLKPNEREYRICVDGAWTKVRYYSISDLIHDTGVSRVSVYVVIQTMLQEKMVEYINYRPFAKVNLLRLTKRGKEMTLILQKLYNLTHPIDSKIASQRRLPNI